jgi:outer membrane protein assembly factor BamB
VLVNFSGLGIFAVDPDRGREQWRIEQLDRGTLSDGNSMTSDGALAYHFFKDVLSVIDLKTGKTVYEQSFDESASYASPFVVKDKVYLVAGPITYVIRAGREYQRLAECKIEEATDVSPAVVTGRIYFRTEENLYCIAGTGHGR